MTEGAQEQQTRQWAMWLHFSQFAGYLVPLAGLVVPIVIWQVKKSELPGLDAHGKVVVNWIVSAIIYGVIGVLLIPLFFLGFVVLGVLSILAIVFPIIGGVKASGGEVWKYPLSFPLLK